MKIFQRFILVLFLLLSATAPTLAQDDSTTLSYDTAVMGSIDDANPRNVWSLDVNSMDRIAIRVERGSGNLLPDLILRDPNGDNVAQSRGTDNTGAVALIDNIRLERTGSYQVLVQRVDFEEGLTSGDYNLEVILLAGAADNELNASVISPLEYNTFVEGRITAEHWAQRYSIGAAAEDYIQVTASRNAGTLMPEVELLDSEGTSLRTGFLENSGDSATLTHELPQAGTYTVIVRRNRGYDGESFGTYRLDLDLLGAGESNPLLDTITGTVEFGTPLTGQLLDGQWYQDWTLSVDGGHVISVILERPLDAAAGAGNLRPEILLLDADDQELRRGFVDNSGARAVIDRYVLNAPGEYIVRATRERQKTGLTGGSYVLTVLLDGAGSDSPLLQEIAGIVAIGDSAEGEISNAQWMEVWEFDATGDQRIDVLVERTDGTLIPRIEIQDTSGQSLRSASYERSRDQAILSNYRIPVTATYRIVVMRDGDARGFTSGSYQLSVTETPE